MTRQINRAGLTLVREFEGCCLSSYICPAGVLTIGFGHTGPDVTHEMTISRVQAENFLAFDLNIFAAGVSCMLTREATDNQFAAMVSLAFNIGIGGFGNSSVLRLHNSGDTSGAARAFLLWNKAKINGVLQELSGLTRRRSAEAALYLDGNEYEPMPQSVTADEQFIESALQSRANKNTMAAPLWRGDTGERVKALQSALARNGGWYAGKIDGDFGPRTEGSVRAYQNDRGLTVDGVVGSITAAALGLT